MPGKCAFQELWLLEDEVLAKWLRPINGNKHKAFCSLCKINFDISHSGINSVRLHQKGKKHKALEDALISGKQLLLKFDSSKNVPGPPSQVNSAVTTSEPAGSCSSEVKDSNSVISLKSSALCSNSIASSFLSPEVTKAEILWAMGKVMSHSSDRSFSAVAELFPIMFPDSIIASKFKMHKDKLGYVVTYGLGPYFKDLLLKQINECSFFSISFDESLNKVSQMGQMDLIVRFWDELKGRVCTRYLTSVFLKRSRAVDLLDGFTKAMGDLNLPITKVMQIAVDGPNVNLKFLEDFKDVMQKETEQEILDVGTCSLHVINNAYKSAVKKTEWDITAFLRAIYFLFKDFPSRRSMFQEISKQNKMPLKLCTIRWTENSRILERAIQLLPCLELYVENDNVKKDPPASNNFLTVRQSLRDASLAAKLYFLQSIISELEPFLIKFQNEKPMIPMLYGEVYSMARSIASRFLKKKNSR